MRREKVLGAGILPGKPFSFRPPKNNMQIPRVVQRNSAMNSGGMGRILPKNRPIFVQLNKSLSLAKELNFSIYFPLEFLAVLKCI
jgi:hypothetical protein